MKRPAFQFYPADWRKDSALQSCSIAAHGLWINVMCIMHECEPYGRLAVNGRAMQTQQLARLVGVVPKECQRLLDELEAAGVFNRDNDGTIYSRRMVSDERLRNVRAEGGKGGAEHGQKGAEHGSKGGRPKNARGVKEPPLNPPPSSSSSSSPSGSVTSASFEAEGNGARGARAVDPVKDEIWRLGKALLIAQGETKDTAGTFLGKLCKDYGQMLVLEAVRDCVRMTPAEAKAWLVARCQERRAQAGNKQTAIETRNDAEMQRALQEAAHGAH